VASLAKKLLKRYGRHPQIPVVFTCRAIRVLVKAGRAPGPYYRAGASAPSTASLTTLLQIELSQLDGGSGCRVGNYCNAACVSLTAQ